MKHVRGHGIARFDYHRVEKIRFLDKEDVIITLANEPRESFRAAVAAFLKRQMRAAAVDIRGQPT